MFFPNPRIISMNSINFVGYSNKSPFSLGAKAKRRDLRHPPTLFSHTIMEANEIIAKKLGLRLKQVTSTIDLLTAGATIPFISRYRKEATGGLNEVQVAQVKEENDRMQELIHRREYVLTTIEEQGKLTDDLRKRISDCWDPTLLEDIYLPFKPKRRTRAEVARQKGLEPLANQLLVNPQADPAKLAARFVGKDVADVEEALQGARDILAERINEDEQTRQTVRRSFDITAMIQS